MKPLRICLLAAVIAATGCATDGGVPGSTVPTSIKAGQSWVVTRPLVAAQVLDTCSRDSPARHPGEVTGYWAPSREQVEQLESRLAQLQSQVANPGDFDRQYVGIEANGRRLIYINAFHLPNDSEMDPARTAIRVCDGGAQFWGALYDPELGTFSDVSFNGPG
ncbi:MAG TPA: hypothetical protein VGC74_15260 [Stenotrophomonas sp.]